MIHYRDIKYRCLMMYNYWTQDRKTDTTDTHAFNMHICVNCKGKKIYNILLKRLFGFSPNSKERSVRQLPLYCCNCNCCNCHLEY